MKRPSLASLHQCTFVRVLEMLKHASQLKCSYNLKDVDLCYINPIFFVLHEVCNLGRCAIDVALVLKELSRAAYFQPFLFFLFYPLAHQRTYVCSPFIIILTSTFIDGF